MHENYPHLSLAQIHAALAHYHDHQEAFDQQIAAEVAEARRLREASMDSPLRQKLRAQGYRA